MREGIAVSPKGKKIKNMIFELAAVEIGQHFYWNFNGFLVHGQVLINTWIVIAIILGVAFWTSRSAITNTVNGEAQFSETDPLRGYSPIAGSSAVAGEYPPAGEQKDKFPMGANFIEFVLEFIRDIAKTQIEGRESIKWVPFIGTLFLFIFVSNWSGALIPWRIFELPNGELGAPTNDINTTVALALLTSVAYFYAGLTKKGLNYFGRYIQPTPILFPINVLEDFTKPLSLSFRLFGNILADELVVAVLITLVPLVIPIPLIFLGLFTSAIQALIFATLAGAYIGEALETHH